MGKSIFDLTDKTGYESPWEEDWKEEDFASTYYGESPDKASDSSIVPPGTPPILKGEYPEILRERYNAMQIPLWDWSGSGYSKQATSGTKMDYTVDGNSVTKIGSNYYMPYWLQRPVGSRNSQDKDGNPLGDIVVLKGIKIQTTINSGASYARNNIPAWAGAPATAATDQLLFPGGPLPGFPAVAAPPGALGWGTVGAAPVLVTAANPTVFMFNGIGNWAGYTFIQTIQFSITILTYLAIRNLVQLKGLPFQMSDVTNNYVELNVLVTHVTGALTTANERIIRNNLEASFGEGSPSNFTLNFTSVPIGGVYLNANNFEISFPKPTNKKGLGIQSLIFR